MPLRQAAQDLLRLALVVLVGAVEEIDARVADGLVHGARRRFVGVAAKGHGAEAEFGDGDAGTAEELGFHGETLTWLCGIRSGFTPVTAPIGSSTLRQKQKLEET